MDLNPDGSGTFNFILQVWRPSRPANVCYSLVDNFMSTSISVDGTTDRVARVTPSPQHQLQFQTGDVLGFYVESNGSKSDNDNGVVLLNNGSHTNELVWFASIDITAAQTSQSGSCPYPVGTDGVLINSTHAAPVISVSVMTTSCLASYFYATDTVPEHKSGTISSSLTTGVTMVAIFIVVCIIIITIILAVIVKRRSVKKR